jgi:hypothetical protein
VKLIVALFCLSPSLVSGVLTYALSLLCGLLSCSRLSYFYRLYRAVRLCPLLLFNMRVVLFLFLAPSRTNNQPRRDLRDIRCYRAQSGGLSGEWKSSSLVTNMPENYFQQQQQHQLWLPCWSVSTVASTLWTGSTSASISLPISLPTIRTMVSNRLIVDINRSTSISDAVR